MAPIHGYSFLTFGLCLSGESDQPDAFRTLPGERRLVVFSRKQPIQERAQIATARCGIWISAQRSSVMRTTLVILKDFQKLPQIMIGVPSSIDTVYLFLNSTSTMSYHASFNSSIRSVSTPEVGSDSELLSISACCHPAVARGSCSSSSSNNAATVTRRSRAPDDME